MNAPDKIYIPNSVDVVSCAILTNNAHDDDIEYIRKRVITEWLDKQFSSFMEPDAQVLIEELEEFIESL